ncbi:putative secreted protein [Propionispora sp. 2/2-37]|uniref:alkaline phosphatase n=1 Tax=Propionispora sp. 2/2-37 TaxID=1677858 RepID=UPI0006BB5B15|nr:alkaline phosphatase [Propionispora sp. 2/2-37]CUH97811.1 putative secreted protein [Propionispora sp. 2/2-37]
MSNPNMSLLGLSRFVRLLTAFAVITALVSGMSVSYAAYYAPVQPSINIMPIDRAKFLTGQTFDFAIEVKTAAPATAIDVTINGVPAEKYFGKQAKTQFDTMSTYRINDVAFRQAGGVTVTVTAKTAGGVEKRTVQYEITNDKIKKPAKNVILFIGDGMSLQARQIARILAKGITEGKYNDLLEMEKMSNLALITTSGNDSLVTDSANSASAYATGHKSSVNAMGVYADSTKDPFDDPKVENIIELAKRTRGMSTGIVSTANITDATPAAMLTHTRKRSEQNYIAADMLTPAHRPDVILGGGSRHFLPQSVPGSKRTDERNLFNEFQAQGYTLATTKNELKQAGAPDKILGLFQLDNMDVYVDREVTKNPAVLGKFTDQPTLMDMTQTAINSLSKNKNGFFLMVEGACIDKQLHAMDWQRAAYDTIEMDKAVGIAKEFAKKNGDTLIIVVADHAHGASITGTYHELDGKTGRDGVRIYADAGWPTFADADGDGFPNNPDPSVTLAVQFANHPEYYENYKFQKVPTSPAIMANGKAVANPKRSEGGQLMPGNIPASDPSEVHSADDVPLTAQGPGADYFKGIMDNTEVFYGIVRALGLDGNQNKK